jgi:putative serine protease PepD
MTRVPRLLPPILVAGLAGAVIALIVTSGGSNRTVTVMEPTHAASVPSALPTSLTSTGGMSINQIFRQDGPGVVDIVVTSNSNSGGFFGGTQQTVGEGAGVVYNRNGDILTDEHVVDGATSVAVTFEDGYKVGAKVVGTDPSTDVAVIHVNAPASQLHPIALANSSTAEVGDPVVAIGSPFSYPETVTSGIVSAVGRTITAPNGFEILGAIQTDAAINPGNSGGPLLDANGHVLGLSDQIDTNNTNPQTGEGSNSGVGFAIPADMVAHIASKIIAGQPVRHSYVGVFLNGQSTGGAQILDQPGSVAPSSPALAAGLKPGDLITAIDGRAITSTQQFIETVDTYPPGQKIRLTVKRGGSTLHIGLTLGTRPSSAPSAG